MALLRFLFILLIIYLSLKVFTRFILPVVLRITMRRVQNRFYEQNPHLRPEEPRKEGKVTINRVSKEKSSNIPTDIGEYTDYEEVK